ncbi:MAG: hypothetical protein SFX73_38790 [Kofleriaceae bacterium]|nr:hypothetical protein [Kofleriaceae bacterium]
MTRRFLVTLVAACGTEQVATTPDASTTACTTPTNERYLPLAVGTRWTYRGTPDDGTAAVDKTSTVEAFEDVGDRKAGTMAFRTRTEKIDGITIAWQADGCTSIARHRERSYDLTETLLSDQFYVPEKVRVDESPAHLVEGVSWVTSYVKLEVDPVTSAVTTKDKSDVWTVEATADAVTVPAGTFTALRVHRIGEEDGQAEKWYWFARGVGKVKEVGKQTEELVRYELAEPQE